MILFHFTTGHAIQKIRRQGLTKGVLPWNLDAQGNPTFRRPFQWLTRNGDFAQPWALLGSLPFARNEYRITVCVPKSHHARVHAWNELVRRCRPDSAEEINSTGGDVENWAVFHGPIPPTWFLEVARNTGELLAGNQNLIIPTG